MTDGVQDQNIRDWATIDAGEVIPVVEGTPMEYVSAGVVQVYVGGNYAGLAMLVGDNDPAVAGDKIGLDHWGVRKAKDSGEDVLALGDPLKPSLTGGHEGELRLFVDGVDSELIKIGFLARTGDGDDVIMVRLVGGR